MPLGKRHRTSFEGGQVGPGPNDPEGCPKPTETVCIEVDKVYDFCFREVELQREFRAPLEGGGVFQNLRAECEVFATTCEEVAPRKDVGGGLRQVFLRVTVLVNLRVVDWRTGAVVFGPFVREFSFMEKDVLCAPPGTQIACHVTGDCVCDVERADCELKFSCSFSLCKVIQSKARVKLLVPSFGFCTPSPCRVSGLCPPTYPPQCDLDDDDDEC